MENSLLTAVLLGLWVRLFFTEAFGWVFSGLVVPGYLAAVMLLRPLSAAVILVEALLTYLAVRGLERLSAATRVGTPPFGRDRFVWMVVASIVVRVAVEGVVLPLVDGALRVRGIDLSHGLGFYGIGLVLVPLTANALWKPGLARGSFQLLVTTAVTAALVELLLATTNLSLASIGLSFERVAVDFSASPKAYLLVMAGALVASRANLRFGWDTSGVLIPGLLCLGWWSPLRLVSTLLEAVIVAGAAMAFLQLPRVRDWNVEGPRRVVLVFTIGYAIKLAFVSMIHLPGYGPTDLFGIGYLLPSLLAVKVWQKRNPAVVLLPAVQLSFAALVLGSAGGLLLGRMTPTVAPADVTVAAPRPCDVETTVERELRTAPARLARLAPTAKTPRIDGVELRQLDELVRELRRARRSAPLACATLPARAMALATRLGLRLADATAGPRRFVVLREDTDEPARLRGFGVALVASDGDGINWIVERPAHDLDDPGLLLPLVDVAHTGALLIGGLQRAGIERGDPTRDRDVAVRVMAEALGGGVTVRSGAARSRAGRLVPAPLFAALRARLPALERGGLTQWNAGVELTAADAQRLVGATPPLPRFASVREALATPALRARPLDGVERLLLAEAVLRPLSAARGDGDVAPATIGAAAACGYRLAAVDEPGREGLLLSGGRDGGALLVLRGAAADAPMLEVATAAEGAVELGVALLRPLAARALLLDDCGGAPSFADVARASLLAGATAPALLVRSGAADGTFVVDDAIRPRAPPEAWSARVAAALAALGFAPRALDRFAEQTSGATGRAATLLRLRRAPFVTVQLGPDALERARSRQLTPADRQLLARFGIAAADAGPRALLDEACRAGATAAPPAALVAALHAFAVAHHPGSLARAAALARASELRLSVPVDGTEALVVVRGRATASLVALHPDADGAARLPCPSLDGALAEALAARRLLVTVEGKR